ncbi:shikimate dehydrogenase [Bacillus sp. OV322]|uniref:shikimate dehydrogenase n=1 Tax=Bacillus sp. OV322 TaxID=1882764 RepID=UPI0008F18F15|nr:shikimate dehydrogenase [Bacillus sp. OV322]SFC37406.1 shikimate dehydrogenase [Bacillus sp. OV322]
MMKLYGVIGDPIAHSMSPEIHNDAFEKLGIEAVYHHLHVVPDDLEAAVKGMKAIGFAGFNVTVPHKEAIIPFLDEVDEAALAIGAVNTVVRENGRFKGYNTDGMGFYRFLSEWITGELSNKKTLIIGAGGAARGIYFTLVKQGMKKADIANRTAGRARGLIDDCPYSKESLALSIPEAEERLADYDLIIQTTSSGMSPNISEKPINLSIIKERAYAADIIYNPLETAFLKDAASLGARIENGLGMFVNQAALAFELWTGQAPDTARMQQIVLNKLGGHTC